MCFSYRMVGTSHQKIQKVSKGFDILAKPLLQGERGSLEKGILGGHPSTELRSNVLSRDLCKQQNACRGKAPHTRIWKSYCTRRVYPCPSHIQELWNVYGQSINRVPCPTRQKCLGDARISRLCHECVTWVTHGLLKSPLVPQRCQKNQVRKDQGSACQSPLGTLEHALHWLSCPLITHQRLQRNHFEHWGEELEAIPCDW